jgi:glucose/arabinose dehydrogenase
MMGSSVRRTVVWAVGIALTVASIAAAGNGSPAVAATAPRANSVPAGFTDTLVAKVPKPVALAATPDGRILVVDKAGLLYVIDVGTLLATPALDISAKVCSASSERGMLGVTLDPHFTVNGYVYLYYTFKKFPTCPKDTTDVPVNRVSRFTMVGNTIDPSTETVLIDEMISYHGIHNAGDVGFGNDGMLYVSVGDGGCDYVAPHGCDAQNPIAQRTNTLQGKVLRIKANGDIPATNPYTGTGTARCNQGAIAEGMKCQEIYLLGLRNPFRFAFDPNAAKTRLYVNDVGQGTWEEIDKAAKGANYGWPEREGRCVTGSTTDCGPPPPGFTNPIFAYPHAGTGCDAITGGAFVPNGTWGAGFAGGYLYSDFICGTIFLLLRRPTGGWASTTFASLAISGPVALMFGPHGGTTSLYYTTLVNHGEVHVIDQT